MRLMNQSSCTRVMILLTAVFASMPLQGWWSQNQDVRKMKGKMHLECQITSHETTGHISGKDNSGKGNHTGPKWPLVLRFDDMKANQGNSGSESTMMTYKDHIITTSSDQSIDSDGDKTIESYKLKLYLPSGRMQSTMAWMVVEPSGLIRVDQKIIYQGSCKKV